MADDMLGFAAGTRCARQQVNVIELLQDVRDTVDGQLSEFYDDRSFLSRMKTCRLSSNRDAIKGALLNLVSNADQAGTEACNILLHAHIDLVTRFIFALQTTALELPKTCRHVFSNRFSRLAAMARA